MIRYLTSGESHGKTLNGIVEGIPSNLYIDEKFINFELKRRQKGYGRSERMNIESDKIIIISGVNNNVTTGNPISFLIKNKGYNPNLKRITKPRPGHGDLAGLIKYDHNDVRNVLERASARETAARVAIGSICKLLLKEFNINIYSHVTEIGGVKSYNTIYDNLNINDINNADNSSVRVVDKVTEEKILSKIDKAKNNGDTLGGTIEAIVTNVPIGLGSFISWDKKLDAKISYGIMSIPGIKGVEVGLGFALSRLYGSQVHDEIFYSNGKYDRKTNNAGGIEAGVSNGQPIVVRCVMKPIPTLKKPLNTVDIDTKKNSQAQIERSDVCAVPSCSIVVESVLAFIIANEMLIKFGGDSIKELKNNFYSYKNNINS